MIKQLFNHIACVYHPVVDQISSFIQHHVGSLIRSRSSSDGIGAVKTDFTHVQTRYRLRNLDITYKQEYIHLSWYPLEAPWLLYLNFKPSMSR